ncbi:MAG TPA: class I SAM-dependent methyltransferase [Thermomonas sp.]|nr:class I SAM-dependent methyltransferase [Thermomonas sp.]
MRILQLAEECICCGSRDLAASPAVLMPFVAKRVLGHDPVEITESWGLRDLRQGTAYTVCNSLQCRKCCTLFLDYRFTDGQMAALYAGYRDATYTRQRDQYEAGYAATMAQDYAHRHAYIAGVEAWLAPHLPERPRVLDWGGGDGANTPFLGKGTIMVHDISGVPVVAGAVRATPDLAGPRDYDLITCCQVLEHAPSPSGLVEDIFEQLSARTLLYMEVPHEQLMREHPGSVELAGRKRHWHEHVNFFTEAGLRHLIDRAGLQLVDVHYLPIDNGVRTGEVIGLLARRAA